MLFVGIKNSDQAMRASILRFTSSGAYINGAAMPATAIAIDNNDTYAAAYLDSDGTIWVTKYDPNLDTLWERHYAGRGTVDAMTFGPSHELIFAGTLYEAIDFGGGPIRWYPQPQDGSSNNGYVVKLATDGSHVFSRRTEVRNTGSVATNGSQVVVSGTYETQFYYLRLQHYDGAGNAIAGPDWRSTGLGEDGEAGKVVIANDGRLWWSFMVGRPSTPWFSWMAAF